MKDKPRLVFVERRQDGMVHVRAHILRPNQEADATTVIGTLCFRGPEWDCFSELVQIGADDIEAQDIGDDAPFRVEFQTDVTCSCRGRGWRLMETVGGAQIVEPCPECGSKLTDAEAGLAARMWVEGRS